MTFCSSTLPFKWQRINSGIKFTESRHNFPARVQISSSASTEASGTFIRRSVLEGRNERQPTQVGTEPRHRN